MTQVQYTGLAGQAQAPGTIVPDDYQHISTSPDNFGGQIAQAVGGLGKSLDQVSDAAGQIQSQYDQTATSNAFSQLRDRVTANSWGDPTNPQAPAGLLTQQGDAAMQAYPAAVDRLKQAQADIAGTLTPAQARVFNMQAQRFVGDTAATYDQHRATAQQQWQVNSLDAQSASAQSAAIANSADQDAFNHSLADGRNSIISKGSQLGWSPDVIQQQLNDYQSKTYVGAAEKLAVTNPPAAFAYYQANQDKFTGQDQLGLESRLKPQVLLWGSRDQADDIYRQHTASAVPLPAGPTADKVVAAAKAQGFDPGTALTAANIESGLGTIPNRPGSQYQGTFQMGDGAWAARGGTAANRNDPDAQVNLGVANLVHSQQVAQQALGSAPAGWQTYLVHQQGDGGGAALLTAAPGASAVDTLTPAYQGDRNAAQRAVTANGGQASSTVGQFLGHWQQMFQAKQIAAPAVGGTAPAGPKPFAIGDSLAVGAQQANGYAGGGVKGASPDQVLDSINALPISGGIAPGQPVVLSTGLSSDPSKMAVVQQQLDSLKARGVTDVRLLGVGNRPDLAPVNDQLAAIAKANPGVTFTGPISAGPDGVHPVAAGYRGLGALPQAANAAAAPGAAVQAPADPRAAFPAMMDAASKVLDPFGQSNPQYQEQVMSRLRAKQRLVEFGQEQADRVNRESLIGAAIGLPAASASAAAVPPPIGAVPVDPDVASPSTGSAATPLDKVDTSSAGLAQPAPARPTSLNALLSTPQLQQAWATSTPETQRSVMSLVEHNATGQDPPVNPASQGMYYRLSGAAVNDPVAFSQLDLSDPQYTSVLPHAYWNTLVAQQRTTSNRTMNDAARTESQSRALSIMKPDLLAAGIKVDGLKPGTPAAATYDQFTGRLRQSLDDFQQANNRRPTDAEMAKLGQTLLLQGTERGSGWIWDSSTRAFQTDPGKFVPTVPAATKQQIVSAYQAKNGGAVPSDGQVGQIFMAGQAQATAQQPSRRGGTMGQTMPPARGAAPPVAAAAAPLAQAPLPMAQQDNQPPAQSPDGDPRGARPGMQAIALPGGHSGF